MKVDLGINPFTDFWIDCITNSQISILISREPSFQYAAYLNDYYYIMAETKTNDQKTVPFLSVKSMEEATAKYLFQYFSYEPLIYSDVRTGFEKIIENIRQKQLIAVRVEQTILKNCRLYPERLNADWIHDHCNNLFQRELEMWNRIPEF